MNTTPNLIATAQIHALDPKHAKSEERADRATGG